MKNLFTTFALIVFAVFLLATCKHEATQIIITKDTTNNNPPVTPTPTYDSVCFNTQILPLITSSCAQSGCHDPITEEEDLNLTTYSAISKLAKDGDLIEYITHTKESKRMPPPPQPRMDTANISLIKKWIKEGRRNTICNTSNCDTTNVAYGTHIVPLMNTYCKACHNTGNKEGNINLDNYSDVKSQTLSGNLICSITNTGCKFMPQGGAMLSTCNIRKIKIWAANNCPQ
ncbi:MAG: c-type cytochrome domain-containing protein [Bacteroidota bacterium]